MAIRKETEACGSRQDAALLAPDNQDSWRTASTPAPPTPPRHGSSRSTLPLLGWAVFLERWLRPGNDSGDVGILGRIRVAGWLLCGTFGAALRFGPLALSSRLFFPTFVDRRPWLAQAFNLRAIAVCSRA